MKTFTTERLILRRWSFDDLDEAHRLIYSDPEVADFYNGGVQDIDETRASLEQAIWLDEHGSDQGWGSWAVVLKDDGRLLGRVNLDGAIRSWFLVLDPDDPYVPLEVEIGYAFGREHWGNGYAYEACQAIIDYAFKELRIKRIVNGIDPANERSMRLVKRLSFVEGQNYHPDDEHNVNILVNDLVQRERDRD